MDNNNMNYGGMNNNPQMMQNQNMMQGQPMMGQGQPMMNNNNMMHNQQMGYNNNQPVMMQGQPMMMQGQPMMMNPGMGAMPQGMMMNPQMMMFMNMGFAPDPMAVLAEAKSAIVKQQIELLEIFTGCETKNRYHVYITTHSGQFVYLFKCKEESDCCARMCCPSGARPFNMKIRHISQATDLVIENYQNYYALLERPFKCTCFCLARPEMTARNGNRYFGKVSEPFTCCDPKYYIIDPENRIKWKINADCCQCGFCCPCAEVLFPVFSGEKQVLTPETCDGYVKKLNAGVQEMISDATNFEISFPSNMSPEDKFMLIATTLMVDYRHFEKDQNNNNH